MACRPVRSDHLITSSPHQPRRRGELPMGEKDTALQYFLDRCNQGISIVEQQVLGAVKRIPHWKHDHPPVHNVNDLMTDSFTPVERLALFSVQRIGSFGFFLIIAAWSATWLLWNTLAPRHLRFDPAPAFVMWLFLSNMIQI